MGYAEMTFARAIHSYIRVILKIGDFFVLNDPITSKPNGATP